MNKDVFEGKWKQMRGEAKVWWGKLTDDDLDKVAGQVRCLRRPASGEIWLFPRARRRGDRKAA